MHPTRRELRENESRGSRRSGRRPTKRRRRFGWLWALVIFLLLGAGATGAVWTLYEDQVRKLLGWELPIDYVGAGNGEEVTITITSGQIGADVARTLADAGVTMTFDAFYTLLLQSNPSFIPGTYLLEREMSAEAALAVLLDPENRVVSEVLVREGITLPQALAALAAGTGIPLEEFEAAAADYAALGVPSSAPSAEGYLFPATYNFDPGISAQDVLQRMVVRMYESLDAAGVAVEDRHRVLTMAALIQKEGGSKDDFYKVSRVFQNRLDIGMLLQSDATVSYGSGGTSIHTTDSERGDAGNPYNTYVHLGLPVGPISAPGDDAIDAALNPVDGPWLYFVLVNGITGETKFSTTNAQHSAAVLEWQAWYRANPGWDN